MALLFWIYLSGVIVIFGGCISATAVVPKNRFGSAEKGDRRVSTCVPAPKGLGAGGQDRRYSVRKGRRESH